MKASFAFIALLCVLAATCSSCDVDPVRYRKTLEASGFSDVKLTGWQWFVCGDDTLNTGFEATNPKGQRVSGVVCCGYAKNCTVRF